MAKRISVLAKVRMLRLIAVATRGAIDRFAAVGAKLDRGIGPAMIHVCAANTGFHLRALFLRLTAGIVFLYGGGSGT